MGGVGPGGGAAALVRGGRQRRRPGGRGRVVYVRASEDEWAAIQRRAAEARVSAPRLLVETVLGGPAGVVERRSVATGLLTARRALGGVANNLNQLARVANVTGQVPPATPATVAQVELAMGELLVVAQALAVSFSSEEA